MALVPVAVGAADLGADHSSGPVLDAHERPGHLGVERRPAAARVELGFSLVELGAAAGAVEGALLGIELVILSRAGGLRAGLAQDVKLVVNFFLVSRSRRSRLREEEKKNATSTTGALAIRIASPSSLFSHLLSR